MALRTLLLLTLVLAACSDADPARTDAPLRVGGSVSARDVVDRLLEGYAATDTEISIQHVRAGHSGSALEALRQGEIDLAYLSREPTDEERAGLYIYPFAKDPLAFAVHKGTGLTRVTTRDLRALYRGAIRNWSELGGADLPVVLLDRPEFTSPKLLLRAGPFGNLDIHADAVVLSTQDLMDEALGSYPGAVGYTSLRSALANGDRVDVIRLDGCYPEPEQVRAGTYRLARTLAFAVRDEFPFPGKRFLDFVASSEGRRLVEARALVPLRREILVAVPPMRNIVAIEVKYGGLARFLQQRLGRPVELVHQASYTDLVEAFRNNRVDAAFLGSFSYLLAHLEVGVESLARPDYDGVSHYRGVLYVARDAPYTRIEDLKGARVVYPGVATTAGYVFPLFALRSQGLPNPDAFFGSFVAVGSHEAALKAVLEGTADAAAAKDLVLEEMVREDPALRGRLRELAASPPVPSNAFAAGPLLSPELRSQIRGLLLSLHESPRGRKALRDMGANRFVITTDTDYGALYDMVGAVSDDLASFFQYR